MKPHEMILTALFLCGCFGSELPTANEPLTEAAGVPLEEPSQKTPEEVVAESDDTKSRLHSAVLSTPDAATRAAVEMKLTAQFSGLSNVTLRLLECSKTHCGFTISHPDVAWRSVYNTVRRTDQTGLWHGESWISPRGDETHIVLALNKGVLPPME